MLTKINRTIAQTNSGAVQPFAVLEVIVEATGSPANLFSDSLGNNPISNPVTSDASGFVGFYVAPGIYRFRARQNSGGPVLSDVRNEPVFNVLATQQGAIELSNNSVYESIRNLGLVIFAASGNIIVNTCSSDGGNLSPSNTASVTFTNPFTGSVRTATFQSLSSTQSISLTSGIDFGLTDGESREFYVYACYNDDEGFKLGIAINTNFDESGIHTTEQLSIADVSKINTAIAMVEPTAVRLLGRFTANRGVSGWTSVTNPALFSGSNTYINPPARNLLFSVESQVVNSLLGRNLTQFQAANVVYSGTHSNVFAHGNTSATINGSSSSITTSFLVGTNSCAIYGASFSGIDSSISCTLTQMQGGSVDSSMSSHLNNGYFSKISSSQYSSNSSFSNVTILSSRSVAPRKNHTVVLGYHSGTAPHADNITIELDAETGNAEFTGTVSVEDLYVNGVQIKNRKANTTATTDPGPDDDETEGYEALSPWVNTLTREIFVAISVAAGDAVWEKATLTIDELGNVALMNANTIGQNIIQAPNPSAIRFGRANADNSWSWRTAAEYRGDLGLGNTALLNASTIGQNIVTAPNPGAIRFGRANADGTWSWLDALNFRAAIGVNLGISPPAVYSGGSKDLDSSVGETQVLTNTGAGPFELNIPAEMASVIPDGAMFVFRNDGGASTVWEFTTSGLGMSLKPRANGTFTFSQNETVTLYKSTGLNFYLIG